MDLATLTVFALLSAPAPSARPTPHQQTSPFADALLNPPRLTQSGQSSQGKPTRDSLKNGTLIGLVAGAATGVFLGAVGCGLGDVLSTSAEDSDCTGPAVLGAVILTSIVFSLAGMINAVFAKNFDHVNWIPTFILTPLTYFGGVFYSIDLLPAWAQKISVANPILHMVNAFRYGFLGTSDVSVPGAFVIMLVCVVVLYVWVQTLLNRGSGIRD